MGNVLPVGNGASSINEYNKTTDVKTSASKVHANLKNRVAHEIHPSENNSVQVSAKTKAFVLPLPLGAHWNSTT